MKKREPQMNADQPLVSAGDSPWRAATKKELTQRRRDAKEDGHEKHQRT